MAASSNNRLNSLRARSSQEIYVLSDVQLCWFDNEVLRTLGKNCERSFCESLKVFDFCWFSTAMKFNIRSLIIPSFALHRKFSENSEIAEFFMISTTVK